MDHLLRHIEALIFVAPQPISFKDIKDCLEGAFETEIKDEDIRARLDELIEKFNSDEHAFELVEVGGGLQFLSKAIYFNTVGTYLKQKNKKQLSRAALETLSIIAYKQPVTKSEVEKIRGVSCDYSVQKLLEKELIFIQGRSDSPGRPLIYGTSDKFMSYFGLKSISDLPKPKDFKEPDQEIGAKESFEEDAKDPQTLVAENTTNGEEE